MTKGVVYKDLELGKNTRLYELHQKKDFKMLDAAIKEMNDRQREHLRRFYKFPDEKAEFDQALLCYGLK
jgi:hypothetical protein